MVKIRLARIGRVHTPRPTELLSLILEESRLLLP